MLSPMRIVGISGSLRRGSLNRSLLTAAVERAPAPMHIEAHGIDGIPLYDGDLEAASGVPEAVTRLKDAVATADGLLLVTPEYNQSIPGVFKNAIDWMSRPGSDIARVFGGKPVGLIGASPGRMGTISSQTAWLPVFRSLALVPYLGRTVYVSAAGEAFQNGVLASAMVDKLLSDYLTGLRDFVATRG